MTSENIKGALLEYIIREMLKNCGFTNVKVDPEGIFSYESMGLFFINGRGAAHDADIIMNPPIQMPFAYPTQLIFECKSYGKTNKVGLPIIRNAVGFRNDINEFEIVTRDSLQERKNNRRASYAIDSRTRYLYQVGVASVNDFSAPAVEFAANNKVPLISLKWFLDDNTIEKINSINRITLRTVSVYELGHLYNFLKDRDGDITNEKHQIARNLLERDNLISQIINFSNEAIRYSYVGLLETGDMVFLFARTRRENNILNKIQNFNSLKALKAEIHWWNDRPNVWRLTVYSEHRDEEDSTEFDFYVPDKIFKNWKKFNLDKNAALDIKQNFFSKIFVFNHRNNPVIPFSIISLNREWLSEARDRLDDNIN